MAGGTATGTDGTHPFDRFARLRLAAGSLAIFAHVGAVSSIASILVNFLESEHSLGIARHQAAQLVTIYWGGALLGRFIGAAWLAPDRRRPSAMPPSRGPAPQ